MMRLIVYLNGVEGFINIAADRVVRENEFIVAYRRENMVGMFDVGAVMAMYLSEKCPTEKR